ncbi:hypothetical protein GGX14DRAFT_386924 [Mycena pura]|uniref:Uncharacterized protein n=1 Tax=Mycena pura TaxID=153505 RepID=A0AAD6YMP1_9AGAR|nr:hypothetical protein GGX14DRAFT_386924 [Mycena pura]
MAPPRHRIQPQGRCLGAAAPSARDERLHMPWVVSLVERKSSHGGAQPHRVGALGVALVLRGFRLENRDEARNPQFSDSDFAAMQQRIQTRHARSDGTHPVPDESVGRPKRASKSYCRDAVTSARLNWDQDWKSQRSDKLIEGKKLETRRFAGHWAIDRTVKQFWNNRNTYRSCVNNESTYRGKEAVARLHDEGRGDESEAQMSERANGKNLCLVQLSTVYK